MDAFNDYDHDDDSSLPSSVLAPSFLEISTASSVNADDVTDAVVFDTLFINEYGSTYYTVSSSYCSSILIKYFERTTFPENSKNTADNTNDRTNYINSAISFYKKTVASVLGCTLV